MILHVVFHQLSSTLLYFKCNGCILKSFGGDGQGAGSDGVVAAEDSHSLSVVGGEGAGAVVFISYGISGSEGCKACVACHFCM